MLGHIDPQQKQLVQAQPKKFFRIYKTVIQIMEARGYVVPDESKDLKFEQFYEMWQRDDLKQKRQIFPALQFEQNDEFDSSIAVFYNFALKNITEEQLKKMIQSAPRIKKFFLVVPTNEKNKLGTMLIDKKAQTFIQQLQKKDRDDKQSTKIQLFKHDDLLFNVLKHDLVPEHKVMSQSQKQQLLKKQQSSKYTAKLKNHNYPKYYLPTQSRNFQGYAEDKLSKSFAEARLQEPTQLTESQSDD